MWGTRAGAASQRAQRQAQEPERTRTRGHGRPVRGAQLERIRSADRWANAPTASRELRSAAQETRQESPEAKSPKSPQERDTCPGSGVWGRGLQGHRTEATVEAGDCLLILPSPPGQPVPLMPRSAPQAGAAEKLGGESRGVDL